MKDEFDFFKVVFTSLIIIILIFTLLPLSGKVWYDSQDFTAKVTAIEYYGVGSVSGQNKVSVSFDDGRVYTLDASGFNSVADQLRVGHTYQLEYRTPKIASSPYLVIIKEID